MPALKTIKNFIKMLDSHGAHIDLHYKKKHTYQTLAGGLCTILSWIGITAFFLVLVANVVNHDKKVSFKYVHREAH
jgi:hypothetical protein